MVSRDDVVWAYRICLDREPENESVVQHWINSAKDRRSLAQAIIGCDEYQSTFGPERPSPFWHCQSSFDPVDLIRRFAKKDVQPSPLHVTNFLGVKIRPAFFPGILASQAGVTQGLPIPSNWHADMAEWGSCLRALELAGDRFVMLELGCGWGCWMNNLGTAAKSAGKSIMLYGVEADEQHLNFAHQALSDNEILSDEYVLVHGIAGQDASVALFPKIKSGINWGGAAIFNPSKKQLAAATTTGNYVRVPIVHISILLSTEPVIDFVHVDIQGAELDFLTEIFRFICSRVRYIFIGTHSKRIEAGLFDLFTSGGSWKLEMERAAMFKLTDGRPVVYADGVQAWRNAALLPLTC